MLAKGFEASLYSRKARDYFSSLKYSIGDLSHALDPSQIWREFNLSSSSQDRVVSICVHQNSMTVSEYNIGFLGLD